MPSLAELQLSMGNALLANDAARRQLPPAWFSGALPAGAGLRIHRNTVLGGCVAALRISYPATARALGEAAFDAMAADYARAVPPTVAVLASYGATFSAFVAATTLTEQFPWLPELAAFEWQFDSLGRRSAREPFVTGGWSLAPGVTLQLARTLRLHRTPVAVELLREHLLQNTGASPVPAVFAPREPTGGTASEYCLAMWRSVAGVNVQPLSPCAARFIEVLLRMRSVATALQAAQSDAAPEFAAATLEREVLRAGFARLQQQASPGDRK